MKNYLLGLKTAFLLLFFIGLPAAHATHLVGGEVTYKYLGTSLPGSPAARPFRYELTFNVYVDRNSQFTTGLAEVGPITGGIYGANNEALLQTFILNPNPQNVQPPLPAGCNPACLSNVVISLNTMRVIIDLPFNASGYRVIWQRCCRNTVTNLQNSANAGNTYSAFIPSPIYLNSSPQFTEPAIPFMLSGDTATFLNNAFDPENDRLVYSFVPPYNGGGPGGNMFNPPAFFPNLNNIPFAANHTLLAPFGPGSFAFINPASGLTKYFAPAGVQGAYVITIEIKEYRTLPNGVDVLLSTTRRELQIIVKNQGNSPGACPANATPSFNGGAINIPLNNTTIEVSEGGAVSFNVGSNDLNNDSITLTASSRVISGSDGYTGPLAIFARQKGRGNVAGSFSWQTGCGQAGQYDINIKATDNGCPSRINSIIVSIKVLPLRAPTPILGQTTVCSQFQSQNYSVSNIAGIPTTQLQWKAINGTVLSSSPSTASVRWQPGAGVLRLIRSNGVCKDSTTLSVNTFAEENLVITPAQASVCPGQSLSLSATGSSGGYIWSTAGGQVIGNGASITVNPTATTRYIVAGTGQICTRYDTIDVQLISPIVGIAGLDRTVCSGDSVTIGTAPLPNYTYQWSPTTGLSFPNRANPKVLVTNNTLSTITQTYVLTATFMPAGCISKDTVRLNVIRKPQASVGLRNRSFCSGQNIQLGINAVPIGIQVVYRWQPTTGLSNPDTSNPFLSLTIPGTFVYVLTASTAAGFCASRDTVTVVVSPRPNFGPLAFGTVLCAGISQQVGANPKPNLSYRWLPATGISDTLISNPFLTLTNPTTSTINQSYNVRITNNITGCFKDTSIIFSIQAPFVANLAGIDRKICSGQSTNVGAASIAGYNYLWTSSGVNVSNPTIANPNFSANYSGPDSLRVVLILRTSRLGSVCFKLDTAVVIVRPLPLANAGPDTISVCSGQNVILGTSPVNGLSYRWSSRLNLSDSTVARPVFSLISTQTTFRKYILLVNNINTNCQSRDSIIVRVLPLPIVQTGGGFAICAGQTRVFGASPVAGLMYSWSPRLYVSDTSLANPSFAPALTASAGPVRLRLRVTNTVTGCSDTSSIVIAINPLPIAMAGPDVSVCSAQNIQVGAPSQADRSYNWVSRRGGIFSSSSISNPNYILSNPTSLPIIDTLILRVTNNSTNCIKFDTMRVQINPRPTLTGILAASLRVCPNATQVRYKAASILAGQSYIWQVSGGVIAGGLNQADSVLVDWGNTNPAGKVYLTITNSFGCAGPKDSLTIIINPLLEPIKPRGDSVLCSLEGIGNYNSGPFATAGSVYVWQTNNLGVISSSNTNQVSVQWNAPQGGIGKVWVRETSQTNTNFCSGVSDTLRVRIWPSPDTTRQLVGSNIFCVQTGSRLYRLSPAAPISDSIRYVWSAANTLGESVSIVQNSAFADSVSINFPISGTYNISVRQISKKGCTTPLKTKNITVNQKPLPLLSASNQADICPATLNGYRYLVAGTPGSSYKWIIGSGSISGRQTDSLVTINWNLSGPYSLKVIEISSFGCQSDTLTIPLRLDNAQIELYTVSHNPELENTIDLSFEVRNISSLVAGRRTGIYRRVAGQSAGIGWQQIAELDPSQTSYQDNQSANTNNLEYEYKISLTNSCGVILESNIHNTIVLKGFANEASKISSLNWNAYKGWPQSSPIRYAVWRKIERQNPNFLVYEPSIILNPNSQGNFSAKNAGDGFKQCYRIEATNPTNQRKSLSNSLCLDFENKLEIYNIITPNGDGKNDVWKIENIGLYDNNKVEIYNRWGSRVFESKNYQNNFDGGSLESGVYFFYISTPEGLISQKGFLQIMK